MQMSFSQIFNNQIKNKAPISADLLLLDGQMFEESEINTKIEDTRKCEKYYYYRHTKSLPGLGIEDRIIFKKSGKDWYYG